MNRFNKIFFIVIAVLIGFYIGIIVDRAYTKQSLALSDASTISPTPSIDTAGVAKLTEEITPKNGYQLSISLGDLGERMVRDGVIDKTKLAQSLVGKNVLPDEYQQYLDGDSKKITITAENAHFWLNVFWGLGLANKNAILDSGDMTSQTYGGDPSKFASTGGYTLGQDTPMTYYSKYSYLSFSPSQQARILDIAQHIYRPCCGNSAAFPDCNHGMAMLGLVELMVSQHFATPVIYKTALEFNSYWFPQTYIDIAYHFKMAGENYATIAPVEILSKTFSSAPGYAVIQKEVGRYTTVQTAGGSCGA